MAFTHHKPLLVPLRQKAISLAPLEESHFQPPSSKRLSLEESGGVSEAGWRLPCVPRLSDVEKNWELSPRPFKGLLLSTSAIFDNSAGFCEEKSVSGKQIRLQGSTNREIQKNSGGQALPSGSASCGLGASGRFEREPCDREVVGERFKSKAQVEVGHLLPGASAHHAPRSHEGTKQRLVQVGDSKLKSQSYLRLTENPFLDVSLLKKTKSTFYEIRDECRIDSAMSSNMKGNNVSSSILRISKSPNQSSSEIAKPSYFRDSNTMRIPNFPTVLNSKMSFVYLKEMGEKKNDKFEAYVRDFINIYWSQNRPDVKKQKLQDDRKVVDRKYIFSESSESNHQSLSNQNNSEGKKDLISLNYSNHRSIKCDVRDFKKNFSVILENLNLKEAPTHVGAYFLTKLEAAPVWDCLIRPSLKRNSKNWGIINNRKKPVKTPGQNLSSQNLLKMNLLSKREYSNTKVMNVCEKQSKPFMLGILGAQRSLLKALWLNGKGDIANMAQWRCCITRKYFQSSNAFESIILEMLNFHENISRIKRDNRILTWSSILKCKKQTALQNLKARDAKSKRQLRILSVYLQTISEFLKILMKTNMPLIKYFDYLIELENGSKLEKGCLFKYRLFWNYLKNVILERHVVAPVNILTYSRLLEDNAKLVIKKRKLFKIENIVERSMEKNTNSFSTTKNACFPSFEMYEQNSLEDFDDNKVISLTKEISYKNVNVDNLALYSSSTVKARIKSDSQFIWNNLGCVNEKYYDINLHNQELDREGKQESKKISKFNSKWALEGFYNVNQGVVPASHGTTCVDQTNDATVTRVLIFGKLLSAKEGKKYDLVLEEDAKVRAQDLASSLQVHEDIHVEKEEKYNFPNDGMLSLQTFLLKGAKIEETKSVQNNTMDTNEYESILEESDLTNSDQFHLKNNSTLSGNHQFETDCSSGNKECFQDWPAPCLSTESLTMAKDLDMKSKFDLVLKELHMFHEISRENEALSSVETNRGQGSYFGESNDADIQINMTEDLKMATINKTCTSSLCDAVAGLKVHKRHQSSFKWKTELDEAEQEVPDGHSCPGSLEEGFLCSTSEKVSDCERIASEGPAFFPDECSEEKLNCSSRGDSRFSHGISRVKPLLTCSRPIRIGLSRKARLKRLHPYLQ
ncbi:RAD51-associated protein 2 [Ochotona curzoniae]|uniref:RAD51-associated protein 2 n=1 Tax=Ochotona curzoniae TaxID=130825 RepID=UPI001B34606B|nr:RAD51-associated protein 2 [Ochotona curzoniae]